MHEFLKIVEAKKKKKDEAPDWVTSSPEQIATQALDVAKGKIEKAVSILQKEYSRYVMKAWAYMSQGNVEKANLYSSVSVKILQARDVAALKG
jgi:Tfp pilus assembly protein PilF